ncbi:hypothetical protein WJX73_004806 [Symbiochloris irregularis]|uniref:JmjC domain-containing protein n=1 Tax=Symbiochloris irregularis TaxID=706552 RepID=A0AAW1P0R7_9CHLO
MFGLQTRLVHCRLAGCQPHREVMTQTEPRRERVQAIHSSTPVDITTLINQLHHTAWEEDLQEAAKDPAWIRAVVYSAAREGNYVERGRAASRWICYSPESVPEVHGDVIHIPPGWLHQVENFGANLKVATERMITEQLSCYPSVASLVSF